jgi:hypothetical protein
MSISVTYFPTGTLSSPTPSTLYRLKDNAGNQIKVNNKDEAKIAFNRIFPERRIEDVYFINPKPVSGFVAALNNGRGGTGEYYQKMMFRNSDTIVILDKGATNFQKEEIYKKYDKATNPTIGTAVAYRMDGRYGGKKLNRRTRKYKNKKSKRRRSYKKTNKKY